MAMRQRWCFVVALFGVVAAVACSMSTLRGPVRPVTASRETSIERQLRRPATSDLTSSAVSLRQCLLANALGYSPFRDGQSPDQGVYPSVAQIEEDLTFLSQLTKRIRIYSARGPFALIPGMAAKLGLSVMQGISLSKNAQENDEEIAGALARAREGLIDSIVVGNEVLTASSLPKRDLMSYIQRVKRDAPANVPVTTAEIGAQWSANIDLAQDVDYVVAHFYPFWGNHSIDGAGAAVLDEYRMLQEKLKAEYPRRDLKIVIGETGWPSGGAPFADQAIPGPQNQKKFVEEFMALACDTTIPFYYFSAFDEEWKWQEGTTGRSDPQNFPRDRTFSGKWFGSSWGLFQSNGKLKSQFEDSLDQPMPGTRRERDILVNGRLSTFYDIGVDSSQRRHDWLFSEADSLRLAYPSNQEWGAVFVTVGQPVDPPRPWKDFSEFDKMSLDLRGEVGGEIVEIGIKDYMALDDGGEPKVKLPPLTKDFQTYEIPLSLFASSRTVIPDYLRRLYVVVEFVFSDGAAESVYVKDVRYKPLR